MNAGLGKRLALAGSPHPLWEEPRGLLGSTVSHWPLPSESTHLGSGISQLLLASCLSPTVLWLQYLSTVLRSAPGREPSPTSEEPTSLGRVPGGPAWEKPDESWLVFFK